MSTVTAIAAPSATDDLVRTTIERRDVGAKDVLIEIRYAGICHSDIHTVRGDWGLIAYPQVVGHEIVGVVAEIGSEVTRHAVGDRVGVGCMVNSCRECENCKAGMENYCIGSIAETQEMFDFCAAHGIAPEIEMVDAGQVNDAYKRVLSSEVRYRFVIDIDTLR